MIRGTTPTHVFTLPFDTSLVKTLQIIYKQKSDVMLTKGNEDCMLEGDTVTVKLTQADTLSFDYSKPVEIQVRVLTIDAEALVSNIVRVRVEQCLNDEVLT